MAQGDAIPDCVGEGEAAVGAGADAGALAIRGVGTGSRVGVLAVIVVAVVLVGVASMVDVTTGVAVEFRSPAAGAPLLATQ